MLVSEAQTSRLPSNVQGMPPDWFGRLWESLNRWNLTTKISTPVRAFTIEPWIWNRCHNQKFPRFLGWEPFIEFWGFFDNFKRQALWQLCKKYVLLAECSQRLSSQCMVFKLSRKIYHTVPESRDSHLLFAQFPQASLMLEVSFDEFLKLVGFELKLYQRNRISRELNPKCSRKE